MRLLIADARVDLNTADIKGRTALMIAAEKGKCDIVRTLVAEARVDVNAYDELDDTALHKAALFGHHKILELLMGHQRVDLDAKNYHDQNAASNNTKNKNQSASNVPTPLQRSSANSLVLTMSR